MVRPRLRDIAALANVSEPTVSRVLNGRPGVADPTRDRVVDALNQLGYHSHPPKATATRRGVVGIVCGEFSNPVFATWVHHIADRLGRSRLLATVAVTDPTLNPEERCVDELLESRVDGIIFIGGRHAELDGDLNHYQRLVDNGVPMVLVNGRETGLPVPHIRCDEALAAEKAVSHLVQLGHETIGLLLGGGDYIPTHRFKEGYARTLASAGLQPPDGAVAETFFTLEAGGAGARRLIANGVTAVLAGNDLMALGAIKAARSAGLCVPTEFSVIGYDGTDFTGFTNPALTTLRQPFEDMSELISEAIRSGIDGTNRFNDSYVFSPVLVARDSTADLQSVS